MTVTFIKAINLRVRKTDPNDPQAKARNLAKRLDGRQTGTGIRKGDKPGDRDRLLALRTKNQPTSAALVTISKNTRIGMCPLYDEDTDLPAVPDEES